MQILNASDLRGYYLYFEVCDLDFEIECSCDSDYEHFFHLMYIYPFEVAGNSICIFLNFLSNERKK